MMPYDENRQDLLFNLELLLQTLPKVWEKVWRCGKAHAARCCRW